jgi:polyhydroxyalkanoate synthesis regulator phasin
MEKDEFLVRCAELHKLNDVVDKVETGKMSVEEANEIIKEISKAIKAAEKRLKESRRTRSRK